MQLTTVPSLVLPVVPPALESPQQAETWRQGCGAQLVRAKAPHVDCLRCQPNENSALQVG